MKLRTLFGAAAVALACALTSAGAAAQAYPSKTIRIVLGFAAGGATDVVARKLAEKLSALYGQPVIVENKEGAGTNIAVEAVARSAPDGYTLFMGGISNAINSTLYSKLPFNFAADFVPVSVLVTANVLIVNPAVPAKTVQEFIALAKAKPGSITFASSGSGSSIHMSGELFKMTAGVDMLHVPFKGSAPALNALLGGQVDAMFDSFLTAMPHVNAGKLRAIAVTTAKRRPNAPDIPTFAESGLPDFVVEPWQAMFVSSKTPKEIVEKLTADIYAIVSAPDMLPWLAAKGLEPVKQSPSDMAAFLVAETARWGRVVKATGARVD